MSLNPWVNPPSGRNGQTFDSPTFTGTHIGDTYPIAQSWVAVNGTNTTSEEALATVTIPANTLGANGVIRVTAYWSYTNNANNKTMRIRLGGLTGTIYASLIATTQLVAWGEAWIGNANATNSQRGSSRTTNGSGVVAMQSVVTSAIDTTTSTTVVISTQKAVGTDTATLEGYVVEIVRTN